MEQYNDCCAGEWGDKNKWVGTWRMHGYKGDVSSKAIAMVINLVALMEVSLQVYSFQ